jgi:hypothetical protein
LASPTKTFDNVPSQNIIRSPRQRSPNYPSISLRDALDRVAKLYAADGRASSPLESAVKHFGFNRPHGTAMAVVSALRKYGLIEVDKTRVTLTQRAISILVYPDGDKRKTIAIQEAALEPEIYDELYKRYLSSGTLPSEVTLKAELEAEMKFNPKAVVDFVKDFKETLIYAGLLQIDGVNLVSAGSEVEKKPLPKVGDYVQWESQSVLQFKEPKRVRLFSEDGQFAFVDGSNTGLPVSELIVQPKTEMYVKNPADSMAGLPNVREDVFSLPEGQVRLQWPTPLSKESIADLKDWLEIVERKIARSTATAEESRDA